MFKLMRNDIGVSVSCLQDLTTGQVALTHPFLSFRTLGNNINSLFAWLVFGNLGFFKKKTYCVLVYLFFFFNQFQFLQARLGSRSQQSFCLGPRAEITSISTKLGSTHLQLCLFHHVTRLASERAAFSGWLFPSAPCWVPPHFSQLHWKTELW